MVAGSFSCEDPAVFGLLVVALVSVGFVIAVQLGAVGLDRWSNRIWRD